MVHVREFNVSDTDEIVRLDKFLAVNMPEFSRSEIQKFNIKRQNGGAVKFSEKVRPGDIFVVEIPDAQTEIATDNISTDFDLDILFEDDDIIVINKPRGVVMYPSAGTRQEHWYKTYWHTHICLHWVAMYALGLFIDWTKIPAVLWYLQNQMQHFVDW